MAQQVVQFVHPFQQAGAGEGVHGKGHRLAVGQAHRLLDEVHRHGLAGVRFHPGEQGADVLRRQAGREQAVLHGVVVEDVGKRGRQDGPKTPLGEGPHSVLPRGAAAEVGPGEQDAGPGVLWGVEGKARVRGAVRAVAPAGEVRRCLPWKVWGKP